MKFRLFYLPTYLPAVRDAQTHYRGIIEQVRICRSIGIDYAWIVEHHFVRHGGLFPSDCCRRCAISDTLTGSPKNMRLAGKPRASRYFLAHQTLPGVAGGPVAATMLRRIIAIGSRIIRPMCNRLMTEIQQ
jgi:hypothetical protein